MVMRYVGKDDANRAVIEGLERDFRKVLVAFDQAVVSITPVDTGRARANWFMDFGSFTARQIGTLSVPNTSRGNRWTVESGNVFYHNSVEYIIYLDEGSSQQAPQGILDPANAAIRGLL